MPPEKRIGVGLSGASLLLTSLALASVVCRPAAGDLQETRVSLEAGAASGSSGLAIVGASVIDVDGGVLLPDRTILVEGDRIVAVRPSDSLDVAAGMRVVDARGRFVIPGLWDLHVHTPDRSYLRAYLEHGVTGIRDMGGANLPPPAGDFGAPLDSLKAWRREAWEGACVGPRILAAGAALEGPGAWEGALLVPDSVAAARIVDSLLAEGADFVKILTTVPPPIHAALARRARERGVSMVGHVPSSMTAADAAEGGQASLEHLTGIPGACFYDGDCEALFHVLRDQGTALVPTLTAWRNRLVPPDSLPDSAALRAVDPRRRERWMADTRRIPADPVAGEREFRAMLDLVGLMRTAGLRVLVGTDTNAAFTLPGAAVHDELGWLVEAGFTPAEALRAATIEPARFLGLADASGTIAAGKRADLVILGADPLLRIENARRVVAVVANGCLLEDAADPPAPSSSTG
jgi:imidazolonepropionase-like amidohydrolase